LLRCVGLRRAIEVKVRGLVNKKWRGVRNEIGYL